MSGFEPIISFDTLGLGGAVERDATELAIVVDVVSSRLPWALLCCCQIIPTTFKLNNETGKLLGPVSQVH